MLITSLLTIQASTVYTVDGVPIEKKFGVVGADGADLATGESSPGRKTSGPVTWSP